MKSVVLTLGTLGLGLIVTGCVASPQELRRPVDAAVTMRLAAGLPPPHDCAVGSAAAGADAACTAVDRTTMGLTPEALLAQPLTIAGAIRVAFANNPQLRVAFDQLDLAAADVAAALGIGPVTVDAKLRFAGGDREYEVDAVQSLLGLLAAPGRRAAANAELAAARAGAAAAALRLAARVEIAFDDLLAAQADVALRQEAFDAADTAATLRERMHEAGNASDLALARDRDAREMARLELARARATAAARRDAAGAVLGLSGARTWSAAGELRELPAAPPALDGLAAAADAASLELAAGRERRDAAERRAGDERLRSVLPELGAGVAIADDGRGTGVGPALRIGIPLFDPRSGERARANALVRRADHALEADRAGLAAAVRAAGAAALATFDEARQLRDVILPLRRQILDETVKHYNAMDADPFALIAARQALVDAQHQYLDAVRRHWNAMAEVAALRRGVMLAPAAPGPEDPR